MRIALLVEYNGAGYHGWQRQDFAQLSTVQAKMEQALSKVADQPIEVYCAGRTDAGVHALGQVVHFDTTALREEKAWVAGGNCFLPPDIRIHAAKNMSEEFHARFSATARTYRYLIANQKVRPALWFDRVTWIPQALNLAVMQQAAQYFIGEQDFSSFRSSICQSKTPMRNVFSINVTNQQPWIAIEISANAFLHHMVRNIVGVLVEIGTGKKPIEWAQQVIQAKDRKQAGVTASPCGLYLLQVSYPGKYLLNF